MIVFRGACNLPRFVGGISDVAGVPRSLGKPGLLTHGGAGLAGKEGVTIGVGERSHPPKVTESSDNRVPTVGLAPSEKPISSDKRSHELLKRLYGAP